MDFWFTIDWRCASKSIFDINLKLLWYGKLEKLVTYILHVPTYLLAVHDYRPRFIAPQIYDMEKN